MNTTSKTSRLRRLLTPRGAIGCGSLLIGALVIVAFLLPALAGGWARGYLEDYFAGHYEGSLTVEELSLSWTGRQTLDGAQLRDPDGGVVAELSAELPPLWHLALGRGKRIGRVVATCSADLQRGEDGVSNLERALRPQRAEPAAERKPRPRPKEPRESGGSAGLHDLELELSVTCTQLTWTDSFGGSRAEPFRVEDLTADVRLAPDEPLVVLVNGALDGGGELRVDARVEQPFAPFNSTDGPDFAVDARVAGVPTGLLDALAGQGGLLTRSVGEALELELDARGTTRAGALRARVGSELVQVDCAAQFDDGHVTTDEGPIFAARWNAPADVLNELAASALPAGMELTRPAQGEPLRVTLNSLDIALPELIANQAQGSEVLTSTLLANASFDAGAQVGNWSWKPGADEPAQSIEACTLGLSFAGGRDGGPAALKVEGRLAGAESFRVELGSDNVHAWLAEPGSQPAALRLELGGAILALAPGLSDEQRRGLGELLGTQTSVEVELAASRAESADAPLGGPPKVRAAHVEMDAALALSESELLFVDGDRLHVKLVPPLEGLQPFLQPALLPTTILGLPTHPKARVALTIENARLPLEPWTTPAQEAEGAEAKPVTEKLASWLPSAAAAVRVDLARLAYMHPRVPPATSRGRIVLRDVSLDVQLEPQQPLGLRLGGRVDGEQGGSVDVALTLHEPAAWLAREPGADLPAGARLIAEGTLAGMPTSFADAIAAREGLFVDALGPAVDASFSARWPQSAEQPLSARLESSNASLEVVGRVDEGVFTTAGSGLTASFGLTPLVSERVVGKLVPLLVHVSKEEGAAPARIEAQGLRVPLDGDLSKLGGRLRLDLGAIRYQLLPALEELTERVGVPSLSLESTTLDALELAIDAGVVSYDRLPLRVDGKDYELDGQFDIASQGLRFTTQLPLSALGGDVGKVLEQARDVLDPSTLVPLEIGGTLKRPKVEVGGDFLQDSVERLAEDALRRGLSDLFKKD